MFISAKILKVVGHQQVQVNHRQFSKRAERIKYFASFLFDKTQIDQLDDTLTQVDE